MRREAFRKEGLESRVADIEATGKSAEGRQDHAFPVRHEAAPPNPAAAQDDLAGRVEVAGDLADASGDRLVAERQRAQPQLGPDLAADRLGQGPVVVAGDPDPASAALQGP